MTRNIFSILTPRGEGGLGVIRLRGPAAESALAVAFRSVSGRQIRTIPQGRLVFGTLEHRGEVLDEVMLTGVAEGSETEIQCHGGHQSIRRISEFLQAEGFVEADQSEFSGSEIVTLDAIQQEAEAAIPDARSPLALSLLLSQRAGALSEFVRRIQTGDAMSDEVQRLLTPPRLGEILCNPPRVVLTGPPNVGKSSLFNSLVGRNRVIIADIPGTTRDAIEEDILLDGVPIRLVDTAGLRKTEHPIESMAIEVSSQQLEKASLVLFVLDGTEKTDEQATTAFDEISGSKPSILVSNKSDLRSGSPSSTGHVLSTEVSAKTGEGMAALAAALLDAVAPDRDFAAGDPAIFTSRQAGQFAEILDAMKAEDRGRVLTLTAALLSGSA
ncbi:MAG: 50S ribosome-binding GTPase [Planctomycetota bacterium]|nr:50S ribosome-binding GTPase [Planctomycetota bacterium]MDP7134079.1 50S ribosome-binding GTPase [Planctomycetota bacterium]MDP7253023.1 50S ribosome-binding GTPase [Planctomycetota bacterium]